MKKIIFFVLLFSFVVIYFWSDNNGVANDYYEEVNEKFFNKDYLSDEDYIYNTFTVAQDKSDDVRDEIIKKAVNDNLNIGMKTLYDNVLDVDKRNRVSITPLKGYIDRIFNSFSIRDLIKNVVVIENELGVDIFTRVVVDRNFKDNSKNIVYLYPVTFAFGSTADYYVDDDYMMYKAYIKKAIIRLLEEYGYNRNEARMISREIISFYEEISKSSNLSSSYEEVINYYNMVDREYLDDVYSNLGMDSYLKERGLNEDEYSLVDDKQYREINKYLLDEYLMIWKKVILVEILSSYAGYVDEGYYNIINDLNNNITGIKDSVDYKEDAVSLVGTVFSKDIDMLYDSDVMDNEDREYLSDLFNDIKNHFKKMLQSNDWLSNTTKEEALIKLDKMKVYIGVDGYSGKKIEKVKILGNSLVENIIEINKASYKNSLKRLEDDCDSSLLSMSEVNAYYNPMSNAVYLPSAVIFLYDKDASYYEKLGTIGMVIAHEVTHGFDYNGSLFDLDGNMNNWWNDSDRANYKVLKNKVSNYYSKIEVLDGKYINGDKTVNENIADIGALKIISGVAELNGGEREDLKEMYLAFARFWKSQINDNYAKLLLLNDSHSPNKYRVNAVLSLTDKFYEVYNIYPWNDMYVARRERINIW